MQKMAIKTRTGKSGQKRGLMQEVPAAVRKRKIDKKWLLARIAVVLMVLMVIGAGVVSAFRQANRPDDSDDTVEVVQEEEPPEPALPEKNPDELVPEPEILDPEAYEVAAYKPRYFSMPSIGLERIPVVEFGIQNNQLGAPVNIKVVGWFYQSAFPGKSGVAVLDAHGGDLGEGIFRDLPRAQIGDRITMEMGDGRTFTYEIREMTFKYLGQDADSYMYIIYKPLAEDVPTLTMITCTGTWLPARQTYDQRLFVRAALIE